MGGAYISLFGWLSIPVLSVLAFTTLVAILLTLQRRASP